MTSIIVESLNKKVILIYGDNELINIYKKFNFHNILLYNDDINKLFKILKELVEDAVKSKDEV